jgi:hypothetical protein
MALFDRNSGLGGLLGNLGDYGFGLPSNTGGLVADEDRDAINKRALLSGLISAGLTYAATPQNLNTGSALPYLGRAGLAGFGASQDVIDRSLNTAYRNKLIAGRDDGFSNINPLDVTPESLKLYIEGGKKDPSLLRRAIPVEKPQGPMIVSPGSTVYDPTTNLARFTAPKLPAEPQTQAEIVKKNLTPLEAEIDKKSADDLVQFTIGGGFSDVQKSLSQLNVAKQSLKQTPEGKITGKLIGVQDDTGVLKYTNPDALNTKEQVQEIAQRNLRLILGPQFTAKEGEQLINRVYNPALPQKVNAQRLELLEGQMLSAAKTKQEAVDYYNTNGTLKGFKGKLYNSTTEFLNDYNDRLKGIEKTGSTKQQPDSTGFKEGAKTKSKSGKPMIFRNGQWEYE